MSKEAVTYKTFKKLLTVVKTWQKQYIIFDENNIFTVQLTQYSKITL